MNTDGERALWCAVILQALEEAEGVIVATPNKAHKEHITHQARIWFTRPNADFATVCHLAGLDPVAVREQSLARINGAHRKGPGVGQNFERHAGTGGGSTARDAA